MTEVEMFLGWLAWPFTAVPALWIVSLAFFALCVPFGVVSWLRTRKETNQRIAAHEAYWRQRLGG